MQYNWFPVPKLATAPQQKRVKLSAECLKNGIIVRSPNWLGDAVMTLPALVQLRKLLGDNGKLYVVCPPGLKKFYEMTNVVSEVVPLHKAHKRWSEDDILAVRDLNCDIALMFNNSLRDAIYFFLSHVKYRFGAAARFRGFLLKRAFKYPKRVSGNLNKLHHAEKYLTMAYALGAKKWKGDMPIFTVAKEESIMSNDVKKLLANKPIMLMAAGAAYGGSKRWSSKKFNEVAKRWITEKGGMVGVLGTAVESDIAQKVVGDLDAEKCFNLAGKTDFDELIYLLQNCEICIANDSGIMHLAGALGKKGVAIFGPTDPSATKPVSVYWDVIMNKERCAPCFKRECPKNKAVCMENVSVDEVWHAVEKLTD
ncbi:lipopolysaccharide heptosyltransferase II [Lentisphaerota bacterium WC36G]|nr:lipopolysaccharide heptosyltransferase II [Lentisphaerae bacterium WC36]